MHNLVIAVLAGVLALLLGVVLVHLLRQSRERRIVQENLPAFSVLEVDSSRLLEPGEAAPALLRLLERLARLLAIRRSAFYIADRWGNILPSVQGGFSENFPSSLEQGAGEILSSLAQRQPGPVRIRDLQEEPGPLVLTTVEQKERLRALLAGESITALTVLSLRAHDRCLGVALFAHDGPPSLSSSQTRVLTTLGLQLSMTLENYVLMHNAQRRTREFELLTQIGQVVSSRLDPDEVLLAIHRELGRLFDTRNFSVAFVEGESVRFELEVEEGRVQGKRARPKTNGIIEYIVKSGRPLLIRSAMEQVEAEMGLAAGGRPARCFAGVPIVMHGRPVGVMSAQHYERDGVYDQRDLEVLQTAAGQVAVAMENARLFAEQQQRARYLGFLNNVSKTAISSQNAEQMMAEIVSEVQKNFHFDHIGIGILDYATKDIEIKAEAGATAKALGKRVPLGTGVLGRVARTNEMTLVQNTGEGHLLGILPQSRSVLCIPVSYGETLLGVLNVESQRENAFAEQEVLILRTLADLLATALHNSFVFQKMEQQSITDGLTGVKTRRFFLESVQAEWKRSARAGRPFSLVLIDLDRFKEINDALGHLEGDLVLARVGRLLEQKCRQSNVVARYGGDEFVILMPETGVEQAHTLSERLRLWIAGDPMLAERKLTGSFGVATFPLHGAGVEDILRMADTGMYISKHAGGNRVSTAGEFATTEKLSSKQLANLYVEGFLRREETGPGSVEELMTTLERLSAAVRPEHRGEALRDAIRTLTRTAETREMHCVGHGEQVARYAEVMGAEMGLSPDELADLVFAAGVHDVGKIVIPEDILNKAGPLTEDEYRVVKTHVEVSGQILSVIPEGERLRLIVAHHHERFDGHGYPAGLRGEQIPLGARILAVAEAYVNMTVERPYATIRTSAETLAEMERLSGAQFDGLLVRILRKQLKDLKPEWRGK
ncbi:MAG: diguanylate cyclase [Terriglobales bacterium]